jgi:hypothetical protein
MNTVRINKQNLIFFILAESNGMELKAALEKKLVLK